ncbi:MAG TPA: hypothetical protein VKZ66_00025 [Pusillimonas sp.]|uniref:hypothetical protein n=1 Tax=unclassified Pusillimonas TaxID=2640016 RepID=UPI00261D77B3|nr:MULTISPECIES: hypothetical protein [unclassified Pusillimonas]HLU18317.1 hypothetical protein [Pusillimonas sp.]
MEKKRPLQKIELSELDADFIRVLEDLIDALFANGTLRVTDLPPEALAKLNRRKDARARLRDSLDLIDDSDVI